MKKLGYVAGLGLAAAVGIFPSIAPQAADAATAVPAVTKAAPAAGPAVVRLATGGTVTHYAHGVTLYTAPMRLRGNSSSHEARPDGYGQNPGDCGTAKLWTYASNHTYQLSLIGNPGVRLGLGAVETSTNGLTEIPSWVGISAVGQTWTSGRVGIWPGLNANAAVSVGDDQTSIGNCVIYVGAIWN